MSYTNLVYHIVYRRFILDCGGEIDERFFLKD